MQKRLKGFAISWFFAPYLGSADLDFFKRIKNCNFHFDVMQMRRGQGDERVLGHTGAATLARTEVVSDHEQPRTRKVRDDFRRAALERFSKHRHEYDFIISHSNEVPSHAVALECKRLAPTLPWIAYFGDVVSTNPYVKLLESYPLHQEDCQTEAATLEVADLIICNNEYQRRSMLRATGTRHAHKTIVVPHCFEPSMFSTAPVPRNERFRFMHVGTLYHQRRTARPLLYAIDRLLEIYPAYRDAFEVVFYGGPYYHDDLTAYTSLRNRTHARLEGSVSYLESLDVMRHADVLVNIDGIFDKERDGLDESVFFPGKLTDYMGARKPTMGITMPRGPTADILKASGNLVADERVDRIAFVMKRYLDRAVKPNYSAFQRYNAHVVGAEMEASIRSAVLGPSAISELSSTLQRVVAAAIERENTSPPLLRSV